MGNTKKLEILKVLTDEQVLDRDDVPFLSIKDGPFWYEGAFPEVGNIRWFFIFNRQPTDKREAAQRVGEYLKGEIEDFNLELYLSSRLQ